MKMDYDDLPDVMTTLQEMFQTNRAFFASYRFMNAELRDQLMSMNMRNTSSTIALLRHYMLLVANRPQQEQTGEPASVIMNIPITFDASGNFWDPVRIRPTTEQIRAAVEREIPMTDHTCAICQDSVSVATRIRHCGHCFHAQCVNEWFSQSPRCPVCRHDIRLPAAPAAPAAPVPPPAAAPAEERPDWSWYIDDGRRPIE